MSIDEVIKHLDQMEKHREHVESEHRHGIGAFVQPTEATPTAHDLLHVVRQLANVVKELGDRVGWHEES